MAKKPQTADPNAIMALLASMGASSGQPIQNPYAIAPELQRQSKNIVAGPTESTPSQQPPQVGQGGGGMGNMLLPLIAILGAAALPKLLGGGGAQKQEVAGRTTKKDPKWGDTSPGKTTRTTTTSGPDLATGLSMGLSQFGQLLMMQQQQKEAAAAQAAAAEEEFNRSMDLLGAGKQWDRTTGLEKQDIERQNREDAAKMEFNRSLNYLAADKGWDLTIEEEKQAGLTEREKLQIISDKQKEAEKVERELSPYVFLLPKLSPKLRDHMAAAGIDKDTSMSEFREMLSTYRGDLLEAGKTMMDLVTPSNRADIIALAKRDAAQKGEKLDIASLEADKIADYLLELFNDEKDADRRQELRAELTTFGAIATAHMLGMPTRPMEEDFQRRAEAFSRQTGAQPATKIPMRTITPMEYAGRATEMRTNAAEIKATTDPITYMDKMIDEGYDLKNQVIRAALKGIWPEDAGGIDAYIDGEN